VGKTKIEWTEYSWNPVTGCTPASEGCQNCYAKRMANRLRGRCGYPKENPFKVTLHPERLDEPLKWRKPRKVFVCSMSDLFHPDVPFDYITQVFDVMCSWRWPNKEAERIGDESLLEDPGHTYMVLTKRPERVRDWLQWLFEYWPGDSPVNVNLSVEGHFGRHIWFGVTAENQQRADERIPILLQIPAAVRFVSVEPMLGPVDIAGHLGFNGPRRMGDGLTYYWVAPKLDWVICGGESGPGARPMHPDWVRSLRDRCQAAGTPFFFKSWGEWAEHKERYGGGLFIKLDGSLGCQGDYWEDNAVAVRKVGKKKAGRLLDGRTWDEIP
jgi:protein gp37